MTEEWTRAKKIIPGGCQLLSKRAELYSPAMWPAYYMRAKGVDVWDLQGNRYIDMTTMGLGACTLGYADDDVDKAVIAAVKNGSMSTLNCYEEVELAEELCRLHPWASKVRYARTGGEAMAIAVRIARAYTGKDVILFCGYHGFHDWYLAANLANNKNLDGHLLPGLSPKGVPRGLKDTAIPFRYEDINTLDRVVGEHKDDIAAIVFEPARTFEPTVSALKHLVKFSGIYGAPLIFDEISSGFRLAVGGAHLNYGAHPDICVLGKALGNGYPISAIIGNDVMDAAQDTFISSTYWTERVGSVAALATIEKFKKNNVPEHLHHIGKMMQSKWRILGADNNVKIRIDGIYPLSHFTFLGDDALYAQTIFTEMMLIKGFLAWKQFYPSLVHRKEHVNSYYEAASSVFEYISENAHRLRELCKEPAMEGFKRLN